LERQKKLVCFQALLEDLEKKAAKLTGELDTPEQVDGARKIIVDLFEELKRCMQILWHKEK
jgi:hypothetical protein